MVIIEPIEIVKRLLLIVLPAAIVMSWSWLIWRLFSGEPVLPEQPLVERRPVPWHAGTILLVFLLYVSVSLLISINYPLVAGLFPGKRDPVPWSHLMFLNGLVMVILLILVPWVVRKTSGARLADLGLSFHDWWRQAACGVVATLIAAPPVYAIQFAAAKIWEPSEHPLSKMIAKEFSVGIGWLAIVTAVVLAPMFEELVFRGLLQSWLVTLLGRRSRSTGISWQQEPACAVSVEKESFVDDWTAEPELLTLTPVILTAPVDPIASSDRRWLAIVLTSALFAYVHAPQWPAPIALFVLALVIGTVYYRTGSLITAICMHATFNGISTLMLFAAVLSGHKLEPEKVAVPALQEMGAHRVLGDDSLVPAIAGHR